MLQSHFSSIEDLLLAQSKIAANAGHPNLLGGPREWFIRNFLNDHLPSNLDMGYGEIIDQNSRPAPGPKSYRPEVDIVLYRRDVPKIAFSTHHTAFLAEGVMATIEVKSSLTFKGLGQACKASIYHKNLMRPLHASGFVTGQRLPTEIISYVVAYKGPSHISTVAKWLKPLQTQLSAQPDKLVELIVVLGKGIVWRRNACPIPVRNVQPGQHWAYIEQKNNNLLTLFADMLSWMNSLSSPPDTTGYLKRAILPVATPI